MVFMPHWPIPQGSRVIDLGLSRVEEALAVLGNPHLALPPVFHIAGTNGKGSTLAFMQSMLEAAGYKVHKYTSPHLTDFNERIVLAGEQISDELLHNYVERCRIALDDIPVTFFEGTTIMALLAFSEIEADIVLLETGLGGRLDATNVIPQPLLTGITTVGLDHMDYLGPTYQTIAREKAGILKSRVPCVIGYQLPESLTVIEEIAAQLEVPMFRYGFEWRLERLASGFLYKEHDGVRTCSVPSLKGPHQLYNAAMAMACVECLEGFTVTDAQYDYALQHTFWPARMEAITSGRLAFMLPDHWELWLDGAHNVNAAEMLVYTLEDMAQEDEHAREVILIVGMTKGRDVQAYLQPFIDKVTCVYGVRVESEPSAYTAEAIVNAASNAGFRAEAADDVEAALHMAVDRYGKQNVRALICGSLYLAGDVKAIG